MVSGEKGTEAVVFSVVRFYSASEIVVEMDCEVLVGVDFGAEGNIVESGDEGRTE